MNSPPTILSRAITLIQQTSCGEIILPGESLARYRGVIKPFADLAERQAAHHLAYSTGAKLPDNRLSSLPVAVVTIDFGDEVEANDITIYAFAHLDERAAFCSITSALPWIDMDVAP